MQVVNLHTHSHYSGLDGYATIPEIMDRVKELGQTAVALTEHGTLSSQLEAYNEAKKRNIKFIFAVESYFCPDITVKDRSQTMHLCLFAMNEQGLYNMRKLISMAHRDGFYYDPRIDWEMLTQNSDGLIVSSACMGGILGDKETAEYWAKKFQTHLGDRFYIELHTNSLEGQAMYNERVAAIAEVFEIPVVAMVDAHYAWPSDAPYHGEFVKLTGLKDAYSVPDFYLMSGEEMHKRLKYLPVDIVAEALANTNQIVERCDVELDFKHKHYPMFSVPSPYSQAGYLRYLCMQNWHKVPDTAEYRERLEYELEILDKADFVNYFLIAHDLVSYCHTNDISVGPGRGSVVASLVSYLLAITALDPISYGLIFERFCHLERIAPPDVDLDFPQSKRHLVIEYLARRYNGDVYQVRTFGYMEDDGAKQRARQILQLPIDDPKVAALAEKLKGRIDHFSTHASAVIVFGEDPYKFCSIERQVDAKKNITYVVSHQFEDMEKQGLLKQDILGLRTLDVIDNTIATIIEQVDINNLPENDDLTFNMLCRGETAGVFQVESPGMTELVINMQPMNKWDLVPLVAIYRPGPKDAILGDTGKTMLDVFVERRKIALANPDL